MGGLGNQMFQYAAARSLSFKRKVYLDKSFLDEHKVSSTDFTARDYELDKFKNIQARNGIKNCITFFTDFRFPFNILRYFFARYAILIKQVENEFIDLASCKNYTLIYLDGYFQSEKYFSHIRKQLLKEFEFPQLDTENTAIRNKIIRSENTVSLHIRRGDYNSSEIIHNIHGVLPLTYYHQAITALTLKYGKLSIYIFSDDMKWAKEHLLINDQEVHYVDLNHKKKHWQDMALMSACKHHIIANSSFSWWGAWLADTGGDTFAPLKWFNSDATKFEINDFIPQNWTIVNYG